MDEVICHYCARPAQLVSGRVIYPHRPDLYKRNFWQCKPCRAHVGCHKYSKHPNGRTGIKPMGILATSKLRKMRSECHELFDPMWKSGKMSRKNAYKLIACRLGIKTKDCHISWFDEDVCKKMIDILRNKNER